MLKSLGLFVFTNISKILIILEFMAGIYFYSSMMKGVNEWGIKKLEAGLMYSCFKFIIEGI